MAAEVTPEIEAAARELAAAHYAISFDLPAEHKIVSDNVDGSWREFVAEAQEAAVREAERAAAKEEKKAK